jgi:hypothetical protein
MFRAQQNVFDDAVGMLAPWLPKTKHWGQRAVVDRERS